MRKFKIIEYVIPLFLVTASIAMGAFFPINKGMVNQVSYETADDSQSSLVASSNQVMFFEGATKDSVKLPNALYLPKDWWYDIINRASGDIEAYDYDGTVIATTNIGRVGRYLLKDNSSQAGTWKFTQAAAPLDIPTNFDNLYYRKTEHVQTSSGASDASKPIILNSSGLVDNSMLPSSATSAWGTSGNTGTTPGTNFLGTVDAVDLVLGTGNTERFRITSSGAYDTNLGAGFVIADSNGILSNTSTISNSELADMADQTIKGNASGSTAAPSDLTASEAQAIIGSVPQVMLQQSTPSYPDSGSNKLYFKTDNKLYTLDSTGNEQEVGTGSGGGGTWGSITGTLSDQTDLQTALDDIQDAIDNHIADTDGAHADTAISHTPSGTIEATNVGDALFELSAEKTDGPSSSTNGALALFDGTTGKLLKESISGVTDTTLGYIANLTSDAQTQLDAKAPATSGTGYQKGDGSGGFTNQDAPIPIADGGTNATAKQAAFDNLSPTATKGQTIVNDGTNNVALDPCDDDELRVADSSEASGFRCQTANLSLMTEWKDYTLTIGATTTAPTPNAGATSHARWRRVGNNMEIEYTFSQTSAGSAGSGTYLFPIPSGYTIDTSSTGISLSTNGNGAGGTVVGHGYAGNTASFVTSSFGPGEVTAHSDTELQLCIYYNTGNNGMGCVKDSLYQLSQSSIYYSFRASVPIVEFAQSTTADIFEAGDYGPTDYTPTTQGLGTIAGSQCTHARSGSFLLLDCEVTAGTTSASELRVGFPGTLAVKSGYNKKPVGTWTNAQAISSGNGGAQAVLASGGDTYVTFNRCTDIATDCSSSLNGSAIITNGGKLRFTARVPIEGWSTFPLGVGGAVVNSEIQFSGAAGTGSTNTAVGYYTNLDHNTGSAFSYTNSSSTGLAVTINEAGNYSCTAGWDYTSSNQWFGITKDSSSLSTGVQSVSSSQVLNRGVITSDVIPASFHADGGEVIRPQTDGGTGIGANAGKAFFRCTKVSN